MKLSIVVSTQTTLEEELGLVGDVGSNLSMAASMGYDGVELAIRDPETADLEWLLRTVSAYELEVCAIATGQAWSEDGLSYTDPDPVIRRAAIERTKAHIPFAAQTGAIVIVGLLRGVPRSGVTHAQATAWVVEALQECCAAASHADVRIAVEAINRFETPLVTTVDEGIELVERVGVDNMGLLLDTFHMNIEEPVMEESICKCGDRIFHFHVADSNRWYPGGGHIDFRSLLEALYATGYGGHIVGEFLRMPDQYTSAKRGLAYLRQLRRSSAPWQRFAHESSLR